jgi:hypothetical protein
MSCEAGFTDSRRSEQTADIPRAQAGAERKTAFHELENGIETANAILKAAIEAAVEGLDCAFSLFEDCEQDPKNADRISISMRSLELLKRHQEDAEAAIASVFKDHAWEVARALRAVKQAVPAASPHHRQRRPSEVDQGFAVHRQGRLRLAFL